MKPWRLYFMGGVDSPLQAAHPHDFSGSTPGDALSLPSFPVTIAPRTFCKREINVILKFANKRTYAHASERIHTHTQKLRRAHSHTHPSTATATATDEHTNLCTQTPTSSNPSAFRAVTDLLDHKLGYVFDWHVI